jgi:catechol O-methyltransferase
MLFRESKKYLKKAQVYMNRTNHGGNIEEKFLNFVLTQTPRGRPDQILKGMDEYCRNNWMMHVGDEKGVALIDTLKKHQPKTILEFGCYCGYSALLMAHHSDAVIHTVDINKEWNLIASKILEHAGVSERVKIYDGTIQ